MSRKIGYLGAGAWGFCLANLLATNGHLVKLWSSNSLFIDGLNQNKEHPKFPGFRMHENVHVTANFQEAITDVDMIVESVTSTGMRSVLKKILEKRSIDIPFVITSKGIEQKSGLLMHEIVEEMFGSEFHHLIGCLSGPSLAEEVMHKLPTSAVASAHSAQIMHLIRQTFGNSFFRVYPNHDLAGVEFGGAMKNIIAIACGISDGLGFGGNTKAALMTRGLHEIRKLSVTKGCLPDTLNGLSGLGDLCVTCLSTLSRNYRFGFLLAEGVKPKQAKEKIGMVVEGVNTCISALELGKNANIPLPITEAIYAIVYQDLDPKQAVRDLLSREIKSEHL